MKLDNRTAELIAVGAAIPANCQPCLQYHIKKASENGADQQEIADAIEIGKLVRKGGANNMDKHVAELTQGVPSAVGTAAGGCDCGA